jgi:hypothetical protein
MIASSPRQELILFLSLANSQEPPPRLSLAHTLSTMLPKVPHVSEVQCFWLAFPISVFLRVTLGLSDLPADIGSYSFFVCLFGFGQRWV